MRASFSSESILTPDPSLQEGGKSALRQFCRHIVLALAACFLLAQPAFAVQPDEMLDDPALERRARELSAELRCMVCQNQSIDDSDAELAHDLRVLVRERLKEGDSNEEVLDYVVARYGEFVLLKPRLNMRNALLWGTPVLLLIIGSALAFSTMRMRRGREIAPLTPEEEARLRKLLEEQESGS
ncbi:cytochrome c-type biogenesis protein CcmH [Mesorhizobium sp. J18]|uniref:cytochrome c-type biogenesis protein n=1 Tax=Mesorhizobium sp. J18 TaxID=935263 RepID=UPI00119A27CB|nr:cytochrome c-type biogenesis protein [Mesorhizobium sp. J18]TWG99328.1 cytochrome c-type biogenesis protein CcmH [Mesorhizobium sp. J18]